MKTITQILPNELFVNEKQKKNIQHMLPNIRESMKACSDEVRKYAWSILLLAMALQLLRSASIAEISIGGIKLSNPDIIQKILPVAISFVYYMLVVTFLHKRILEDIHDRSIERLLPDLFANNLELLYHPPAPLLIERLVYYSARSRAEKVWLNAVAALFYAVSLTPVAYIMYALYTSYKIFGDQDLLNLICIALSGLLLLQTFIIIFIGTRILS